MLRYVLLALLADGQPRHGYALMKAFGERSGVRLSVGNIYRELQRLLGKGLIVTAANPTGADPRRAPYRLTDAGRQALARWYATPARTLARGTPDALTYRLALLGDMDPERAVGFLDDLQSELSARARAIESQRVTACRLDEQGLPTRAFLQSRHARYLAADIELIDEMRTRLAASRTTPRASASSPWRGAGSSGRRPAAATTDLR